MKIQDRIIMGVFVLGFVAIIGVAAFGVVDWMRGENRPPSPQDERIARLMKDRAEQEAKLAENPELVIPHIAISNIEKALGNLDVAVVQLQKAIEKSPRNALAWGNLANLYREQRKNTEADEAYAHAVEYSPTDDQNYLQYADFLAARFPGERVRIEKVYTDGIARLPTNMNLRRAFASYLTGVGDHTRALGEWKTVLRHEPENTAVREEIARLEQLLRNR